MRDPDNTPFVPILTIMPDYGNAPFLWLIKSPDQGGVGGNLCDGTYWDESFPMTEGLWRKFADWAIAFDNTDFFYTPTPDWDWIAYHARGLHLAHWLKEEVGDAYRVVYEKPYEDPNRRDNERTEILADGTLRPLPSFPNRFLKLPQFCERIISGGQTGADRGALDFAMQHNYLHGGWAPHGREAEDGAIPLIYQLTELAEGGYRQRTRRNVQDSDATLIVNLGALDGGTLATRTFAEQANKPHLLVQLDDTSMADAAARVLAWLREHAVETLNVAGPRESKRPGIYRLTMELLQAVDTTTCAQLDLYTNTKNQGFPLIYI